MRKLFSVILIVLPLIFVNAGRYVESSVLSKGEWFKIQVSQSGVHKITYEQLVSMGMKSPENVRVYGYGGAQLEEWFKLGIIDDLPQVNIHMEKGSDGIFGSGDYILFYAQGPVSWEYNKIKKRFEHTVNPYSNYGYYFLTSSYGKSDGIPKSNTLTANQADPITSYNYYYLHEIDKVNILNSGRKYLGELFNLATPSHSFYVPAKNVVVNETASIQVDVAHVAFSDEKVDVNVDNKLVGSANLKARPSNHIVAINANNTYEFISSKTEGFNVNLKYSNTGSNAYLDYFILNCKCQIRKNPSEPLKFRNIEHLDESNVYKFQVANVNTDVRIWDITDVKAIEELPTTINGTNIEFVDSVSSLKQYIAVDVKRDNFLVPHVIGKIANQNLHSLGQADMVIISPSEFISSAKKLADAHAQYDGITTHIVTPELIYNEFSSGTPDATAYRKFMKMFYDRSKEVGNAPKYLLLFGDGVFDNRQILKSNTDKNIYRILTYQSEESYSETASYVTDDYFGFLDDNEGRRILIDIMDIAVARLPLYTKEQADGTVDKLIKYIKNEDFGAWKNRAIFLADDGDENEHVSGVDTVCNLIQKLNPNLLTRKLYLDSYIQEVSAVGETYPQLKKEFDDYINNGSLFINYMGHSGYVSWTNEQILTIADIENMINQKLPLFITASCGFTRFDDFKDSGGEMLVVNPNGGAMGLISTARTVYAQPNLLINLQIAKELLNHNSTTGLPNTIGEAFMKAKNQRAKSSDSNRMSFLYIGDPAIRLNYPYTHIVNIDSINGVDITNKLDTLNALEVVNLKGSIRTSNDSTIDNSFNGFANILIFDKEETIETLCNDAVGDRNNTPFVYTYRTNPIFSGKVNVKDGKFAVEFIMPKDIRYNFGEGRIVLYAADPNQCLEANGHCSKIIVGGEDKNAVIENDGPEIKVYLNSPSFVNGGKVDENPFFVADIYDQSGINTIGSGIGHDILLKLDNDKNQEFILNNYYESSFGSYNSGSINYPLVNLSAGKHSLYFRVWDLQNNSSSVEIEFEVVPGLKVDVKELFISPNPIVENSEIIIKHDRPLEKVELQLYMYDVSGRMVWCKNEDVVTDATSQIVMPFDLNPSVNSGLYFIKLIMIDSNGKKDKKSTKIFVRRQ